MSSGGFGSGRTGNCRRNGFYRTILQLGLVLLIAAALRNCCRFHYLLSGSMEPQYPTGSLVVVSDLFPPDIGAVCAYRRGNMTVIHRIIDQNEEGYIFQGDANNVPDPCEVKPEEIEGRVIIAFPKLF